MALINCPECGKEISDRVIACPHCGFPMQEDKIQAYEQTAKSEEQHEQPVHNFAPVRPEVSQLQQPEKNPANKKNVIIIGVVVAVIIAAIAIAFAIKSSNEKKAARAAEEEASIAASIAEDERKTYIETLDLARHAMLSSAAEAENVCGLTQSVWYNTIYDKYDSKTFKYTNEADGDFNTALNLLYSDEEIVTIIDGIEEDQDIVADLMKKLQVVPEGLEVCYQTVTELYNAYKQITDLAISPSGSYTTYSENFASYDKEFMKYYDQLDLQIPEE